jgi:hypothetical protein
MNELAQNIILQGEENRPLPTGVTFRQNLRTLLQTATSKHLLDLYSVSQIRKYLFPIRIREAVILTYGSGSRRPIN